MPERLHLGRQRGEDGPGRARAGSRRRRLVERWKARRAAKKRRLAAMSRRRRVFRRIGILATWLLGLFAVLTVVAVTLFYTLSNVPRPETLPLPQVVTIQFSNGTTMAEIGSENRTIVPLSQVPKPVQQDVLAAEDRNFYSEPGVSITGTFRAALNDLTGGDTQGGSGITQQYVKNAYLSSSRSLSRKLKELAIAVKLSRQYSKDQILEFYLNTVYFGRGAYGIEAGAKEFFGVDVSKLNVAQGAVLAALLRAPSYYDPSVNPGPARARWKYVLDGMVTTHHLTQAQENSLKYPKVLAPKDQSNLNTGGPRRLIVQRVLAELQAHGISEAQMYQQGLKIRTTINARAQRAAETAIHTVFAHLTKAQRNIKNALVAVDPRTGGVIAYYGGPYGMNYAGQNDYYDYASQGTASPGSSFKPYTLATALTRTLQGTMPGGPLTISSIVNGSYCVTIQATRICNDPSDESVSSSAVSVSNAMKYSLNTTFDQMAARVGPPDVASTAHAMGVSPKINGKPSLVDEHGRTTFGIGIGDFPVHPLDQAVGFATLANGGIARPSYFVESATTSGGDEVYRHSGAVHRVLDPRVANDVTLTLEPIAAYSGTPLSSGRPNAAKTGTEGIQGDAQNGNSDAWMVGYTPQVSAAVWVGSGDHTHRIVNSAGGPEYGRDLPGRTWQLFMDTYLSGQPHAKMATKQEIFGKDGTPSPSITRSTPQSSSSASSSSPSPTFTITTGFSSPPLSSGPSTPPSSSSSPPPSSPPSTPPSSGKSQNCGGLLNPCPSG